MPDARKRPEYFPFIAMLFVSVLLLSNIIAQKTFVLGPFAFPAAIILFPFAYIFGDVLTEVYGYARTRLVIWGGLICNLLMAVAFRVAIVLPPGDWPFQREYELILGTVPRVVLASMIGYWAGEFANSYVLAKMKIFTRGRYLWTRTIGSTVVGQGVDTALFVVIAFAGILPDSVVARMIVSSYLFKVVYEAAATPLTYLIVGYLKRKDGIDVFDRDTNFNPFCLRAD